MFLKLKQFLECVNGLCSCQHAHKLPQPLIYPEIKANPTRLYFRWEVEVDNNSSKGDLQYLTIE